MWKTFLFNRKLSYSHQKFQIVLLFLSICLPLNHSVYNKILICPKNSFFFQFVVSKLPWCPSPSSCTALLNIKDEHLRVVHRTLLYRWTAIVLQTKTARLPLWISQRSIDAGDTAFPAESFSRRDFSVNRSIEIRAKWFALRFPHRKTQQISILVWTPL